MRTRQKPRKALTLPGRYYTGHGAPVDVRLTDFSEGGCRFASGQARLVPGTPIQIAVAGAGTYPAIVKWSQRGETGVTFLERLDEAEFSRVQNTHVLTDEDTNLSAHFQPVKQAPRRFC